MSHSALAKWIKQYSVVKLDDDTLITAEQIKALQKRNAQLEEENLILKKAIAIFTPHSNAVHSLRHEHAVTTLCRVLGVNRSTYYKFRNRKDSRRDVENRSLRVKILALYIKSDKRLGAQKITESLR